MDTAMKKMLTQTMIHKKFVLSSCLKMAEHFWDIVEMVCDWHANSSIYGTDLIDFVVTRQQNRFHFPEEMFKQVLSYCNILVS